VLLKLFFRLRNRRPVVTRKVRAACRNVLARWGNVREEVVRQRDLEESENVKLIGDVLTHLIQTDSHEADV